MSMYSKFKTNEDLEKNGVILNYGDFRVTIARAGGSNKKFAKLMEEKSKPYRRQLATGTMDDAVATNMLYECYAAGIVLNWEVKNPIEQDADGEDLPATWKKGIHGPDGDVLPYKTENVIMTFENLPEFFEEIKTCAEDSSVFKLAQLEDDAKN